MITTSNIACDFYVGLGETAEWLGSVACDGSPAELETYGLLGPARDGQDRYGEDDYRAVVSELIADQMADRTGWSSAQRWPWNWPDSTGTDYAVCWVNGSVHVFERGYLVAIHYPNAARHRSAFPILLLTDPRPVGKADRTGKSGGRIRPSGRT